MAGSLGSGAACRPRIDKGWGYFVDPGIGVNKGRILALFFGETGVMREMTRPANSRSSRSFSIAMR